MKLLLHICCGPCLIYPLENLRSQNFEVEGFFYNPNIHGVSEYKYRKKAVEELASHKKIKVNYAEYDLENFFRSIVGNDEKAKRCPICWELRLNKAAAFAKANNFDYFTTTLLVSPYQDIEIIRKVGEAVAGKHEVKFYFADFRSGFRTAHEEAKALNIYCQRYCGCVYSEREKYARLK